MPGEPIGRNVVCMDLEAQIVAALNVELIYSHEDLGHLPEVERNLNLGTVLELRLFPRTDVHRVRGAAEDILAVLGVGDPSGGGRVEDGIKPSVNMDGEACGIDIGDVGLSPPIVVLVDVDLVEEANHLGRGDEGTREADATLSGSLRFFPGMVLLGGELTTLVFEVSRGNDWPISATRVEGSIAPGIDVSGERLLGDVRGIGLDTDVGVGVDVEPVKAYGELWSCDEGFIEGDVARG